LDSNLRNSDSNIKICILFSFLQPFTNYVRNSTLPKIKLRKTSPPQTIISKNIKAINKQFINNSSIVSHNLFLGQKSNFHHWHFLRLIFNQFSCITSHLIPLFASVLVVVSKIENVFICFCWGFLANFLEFCVIGFLILVHLAMTSNI